MWRCVRIQCEAWVCGGVGIQCGIIGSQVRVNVSRERPPHIASLTCSQYPRLPLSGRSHRSTDSLRSKSFIRRAPSYLTANRTEEERRTEEVQCECRCQVSGVRSQVTDLKCQVSGVRCVSGVRSQVADRIVGVRRQVSGHWFQCEAFHFSVYIFVSRYTAAYIVWRAPSYPRV